MQLECWNCGWSGPAREGSQEDYEELFDIWCPRCETMLLIVSIVVGMEETRAAAAVGHSGAQQELAQMEEIEGRSRDKGSSARAQEATTDEEDSAVAVARAGPWWVPGTPITFAGAEREKVWRGLVMAHVPEAAGNTSHTGLAIHFAIPDPRKQDLDNLAEPVLSAVVNTRGWFDGRRPNLQWLALRKAPATSLGCRISLLAEPPPDWLPTSDPVVDGSYAGPFPTSGTSTEFAAWLADRCSQGRDARYAAAFRFAEHPNLGEVATGGIKPFIDCMWPLLAGSAGKPEDWRIDNLLLTRECEDVADDAVAITVWAL
jgi:hypothetical protein